MINKINENIWQLHFENFGSCVYVLKINKKIILIDTSSQGAREELLRDLEILKINPEKVEIVILTHNHYDHIGNIELFSNAKIYHPENLEENSTIKEIPEMKVIETPGHAPENKCYLYDDILFSGDTIFHNGIGRIDLPGGSEKQMMESLKKLAKIKYKILCPGHV
jgi:glyoxylase-like metal-dependent hydrolase (beta-lactamase superfamily II)